MHNKVAGAPGTVMPSSYHRPPSATQNAANLVIITDAERSGRSVASMDRLVARYGKQ